MKTIITILLILLLSSCIPLPAQNVISLSYAGNDNQLGLRYDKQWNRYGFYAGGGYGMYNDMYIGSVRHMRVAWGVTRYVQNYAMDNWLTYFSLGVSAHNYKQVQEGISEVPESALFPISCEAGVGFVVAKHLSIGWTFDFIKDDVVFNIGYRFGRR